MTPGCLPKLLRGLTRQQSGRVGPAPSVPAMLLLQTSPATDCTRDAVVRAATPLLLERPELSLVQLADRLGIRRAALHLLFPTGAALVAAVGEGALHRLAVAHRSARLAIEPAGVDLAGPAALAPVRRLVELLVPLGAELMLVQREAGPGGDPALARRSAALEEPLRLAIAHGQRVGALSCAVPAWVATASLYAAVYMAWEHVQAGRLAASDAPALVLRTWQSGLAAPPTTGPRRTGPRATGGAAAGQP